MAESSARAIADEVGAELFLDIEADSFGTPLLSSVLAKACKVGQGDTICLVNADIIVLPELVDAIAEVREEVDRFLLVARRWNLDLSSAVDFSPGWERQLRTLAHEHGELFAPQAIDMFVFPRDLYTRIPPFAIGRSYWDNWLLDDARRSGATVVDATDRVTIIHQNHAYTGFASLAEIRQAPQGRRNFYLLGDSHMHLATTRDATHALENQGLRPTATKPVSVVISHRGPLWQLKATIRALTHQTYPRTFIEIVVADNDPGGSLGTLRLDYPFIKVCTELRRGPAAARNYGAACSTGEILAFLDSDCVPSRDWLTQGVSGLLDIPGRTGVLAGHIEHSFSSGAKRTAAEAYDSVTFLQQQRYVEDHQACVTANMFVYREHFWRVGAFDEEFGEPAGEDWEWAERARRAGTTFRYSSTTQVFHPALRTVRDLRKKLERVLRGNFLQWHRLRASGETDPSKLAAVGPPSIRKLSRRLRRLLREERLTAWERWKAASALVLVWPSLLREWRRVAAKVKMDADD